MQATTQYRRYLVRFETSRTGPVHTGNAYRSYDEALREAHAMRERGDAYCAWVSDAQTVAIEVTS